LEVQYQILRYLIIIIIITMARQPPLSEVTWSCAVVAVGDHPTGRAVQLNPDVTARAIWQAVRRLGKKWPLNFAYETFLFMPLRFFYMP
jgi:hypothetical protein